jgi:MFS family permease
MTAFAASMCFASLPDLYAMALLGGFAFGGHWSVIPAIIADLYVSRRRRAHCAPAGVQV